MGEIMKLAVRLFIFCVVAAALLGVTNEVTKGPIEQQKLAAKLEALNKVLPGMEYEQIAYEGLADSTNLDEIFVGRKNGEIMGYALTASPNGYGGEIPMTIGIDNGGWITQVYVGALQETAGLGSKVGEEEFQSQFIGVPASADTLSDYCSTISGASISSGAFMGAAKEILGYSQNTLGIAPNEGNADEILAAYKAANGGDEPVASEPVVTAYEVKGMMSPFTVEIGVADGKIVSISAPEAVQSYDSFVTPVEEAIQALVGKDIAGAQMDVVASATVSSNAINDALAQAGSPAEGGAKTYSVTGFAPFDVTIEVADGKIAAISAPDAVVTIPDPGLAAQIEALVGQDIAGASIDTVAGVTMSANAINDALKQAAADNGAAPVIPGDPYTVKGMNKFTLYIEVDGTKITAVSAPNHNETPGFGADLLTEDVLSALVGADLADAQIDVKSGVTLTSNAINSALAQAAAANGVVIETAAAAEPAEAPKETEEAAPAVEAVAADVKSYEVKGLMTAFTVEIGIADGKIATISAPEAVQSYDAFKAPVEEALNALVGKDVAGAQMDAVAGATVSSNAINEALTKASAEAAPAAEATAAEAAAADVKSYEVKGLMTAFTVEIGIADGKIASISAPEAVQSYDAFKAPVEEALNALVGKDVAGVQMDAVAGATVSSNAINEALAKASAEAAPAAEATAAEAAAADVKSYEVKGLMTAFTVEIGIVDGKIASISAPEAVQSYDAFKAPVEEALNALVGKDVAGVQMDAVAGATVSSNAINEALAQAAKEVL